MPERFRPKWSFVKSVPDEEDGVEAEVDAGRHVEHGGPSLDRLL
jgi:hypothetical protein